MEKIEIMDGGMVGMTAKQHGRPSLFWRRRGSSLVEMLIALIVLAVVLISMLGMFVISRTAIHTKDDETANAFALRYLEEIEEADFSDFDPSDFPKTWNDQKFTTTATVVDNDSYRVRIRAEVRWPGSVGGERRLELERVISAVGYKNVGEMAR